MYRGTAQFYDFFSRNGEEAVRRAAFASGFSAAESLNIIDIGAGTGEIALILAEQGHRLSCFEPSIDMHSLLLARLNTRPDLHPQVSVFPMKIAELNGALRADVALASSVFSHLPKAERISLLQGAHRHLKPGGRLIFNCVQYIAGRADKARSQIGEKKIGEVTYRHFDSSLQRDRSTRKVTWEFEAEYRGQILAAHKEDYILTMDSPEEIRDRVESFGFKMIDLLGSFEPTAYDPEKPGFVVVATRL